MQGGVDSKSLDVVRNQSSHNADAKAAASAGACVSDSAVALSAQQQGQLQWSSGLPAASSVVFALLLLSSVLLSTVFSAALFDSQQAQANVANKLKHQIQLSAQETKTIEFSLQQGDYIRGQLNSDQPLADARFVAPDGSRFKQLTFLPERSVFFQLVAETNGRYQLQVTADNAARVVLNVVSAVSLSQQTSNDQKALQSPMLSELQHQLQQASDDKAKQALVERFWQKMSKQGTPLVESYAKKDDHSLVTFLWRGAKNNVRLFGSPIGDHDYLTQLAGTDIWYKSYPLPDTTRMSYQFSPDIPALPGSARKNRIAIRSTAQVDPLNKSPWKIMDKQDKFSTNSTLVMDQAIASDWHQSQGHAKGSLSTHSVTSKALENTRDITLYQPAGFTKRAGQSMPVLFFFDSRAYQSKVPTPQILDNLIAEGKIPPAIGVFVSNPSRQSRSTELPCNAKFADFMAQELLPWVEKQTHVVAKAEQTLLSGSSYGGLASACIAYRYPEKFGLVLSQSGSFWWSPEFTGTPDFIPEWLTQQYAQAEQKPIRFYMNAGLFETGWQPMDILPSNRHFRDVLAAKGYEVIYQEVASGHDYLSWRAMLPEGLIQLFSNHSH